MLLKSPRNPNSRRQIAIVPAARGIVAQALNNSNNNYYHNNDKNNSQIASFKAVNPNNAPLQSRAGHSNTFLANNRTTVVKKENENN